MKNVLAVALVVCVTSIALSQNQSSKPPAKVTGSGQQVVEDVPMEAPAPPAGVAVARARHRQTWEYMVTDRGGFEPAAWQKKLNDMAKEGWELDTVDEGHYILRRSVQLGFVIPAGLRPIDGFDREIGPEPFGEDAIKN